MASGSFVLQPIDLGRPIDLGPMESEGRMHMLTASRLTATPLRGPNRRIHPHEAPPSVPEAPPDAWMREPARAGPEETRAERRAAALAARRGAKKAAKEAWQSRTSGASPSAMPIGPLDVVAEKSNRVHGTPDMSELRAPETSAAQAAGERIADLFALGRTL